MAAALGELIESISYWGHLVSEHPNGDAAKWKYQNVQQVAASLGDYEKDPDVIEPSLYEYLGRISLQGQDDQADQPSRGKVNLMTMHAAKGLEFDTVFIPAAEEGIIPHARSLEEHADNIAEERRLFYVAITRARRRLYISACKTRTSRGYTREAYPSQFLDEIPEELVEYHLPEETATDEDASAAFGAMPWKAQAVDE